MEPERDVVDVVMDSIKDYHNFMSFSKGVPSPSWDMVWKSLDEIERAVDRMVNRVEAELAERPVLSDEKLPYNWKQEGF